MRPWALPRLCPCPARAAPHKEASPGTGATSGSCGRPRSRCKGFPQPWSCLWMGCVSAGGRNAGNVQLQGSPLWGIKAHDSQTRAIAVAALKAKPPREHFLPSQKWPESSCCSGPQEEAGSVCLVLRASYFSLRKARAWPVSGKLSFLGQKMGLGDG